MQEKIHCFWDPMYWNCATIFIRVIFLPLVSCHISYRGTEIHITSHNRDGKMLMDNGQCKKVFHRNTQKDGGIGGSSNIVIGYKTALDMRQGRAYRVRSLSAVAATMLRCEWFMVLAPLTIERIRLLNASVLLLSCSCYISEWKRNTKALSIPWESLVWGLSVPSKPFLVIT